MYTYCLADAASDKNFNNQLTLGIEVTEPEIAATCGLGNIDPQHIAGASSNCNAAIEECLTAPYPPKGTRLLTIRPDLDALGAMAILNLRAEGHFLSSEVLERVARVAASDRFDKGNWPGPIPLPTRACDLFSDRKLEEIAAMSACAHDRELTLMERVSTIQKWLISGQVSSPHIKRVYDLNNQLLQSLAVGATRVEASDKFGIAVVISLEKNALRLGYHLAPVVVAVNPVFRFSDGLSGRKYTIACWSDADANLDPALSAILRLESGWGGQKRIKGSPQRHPSKLDIDTVVGIVSNNVQVSAGEH